jgi:protein O-mannosyl-transferase
MNSFKKQIIRYRNKYYLSGTVILLLGLVLFTYSKSLRNEFVDWDDYTYVVNNDQVRHSGSSYLKDIFTTPVSSNFHPLTILSMRLDSNDCRSCPEGISPEPFIRDNVILHLLNTLLVFTLIFIICRNNILIAFLVAAVFGVHPMHVESVAWISERKDVLYAFFFLSGLITYVYFKQKGGTKYLWYVISFVLFVLSCLSKATAVVFPVVLILLNFWLYQEDENSTHASARDAVSFKNLLLLLPFFIVSIIIGLLAYKIQSGENFLWVINHSKNQPDMVNAVGPFSLLQRFQIAGYGFFEYMIKFFVPVNLLAFYPYPNIQEFNHGSTLLFFVLSMAATIIIAVFVIFSLRKTRLYAFGIGFYFITICLVLQFLSVGMAIMADRYTYLPYIGLALIPATLISNSSKRIRILLMSFSVCFITILIIQSKRQIKIWSNTETLWTNVINKYPDEELPRRARGKYYSKKSLQTTNESEKKSLEDKALIDFSEAIKAGTTSADVYQGTGVIFGSKGDLKNALLFLNKAISMNPRKGAAYYNRALILERLDLKTRAIEDYNMALIYNPDWALQILNNRSNLFLETGKFKEAVSDFDYLIFLKSNNFLYYSNRAFARMQTGDYQGAVSDYRKAITLNPEDNLSKQNLEKLQHLNPGAGKE